ncbi:lipoprotein signal peptidase [Chitinophagaceae bacterium LB-8]|uniref:Lipoprotein signal peptidase n=1 Tax=Paraflavisolibacter caeni TaxID=2982496 RepID=A0A9X3BH47_9BACT|nr:lipoprotein signal peptidase [Paraflavisolibacter caeni]MCU7548453.1 lipoprotein signal peptidase [Paraflavisolibacter caeni]
MKLRSAVLIIVLIIIADQALKVWIKTTYPFGHIVDVLGLSWFKLYFIENEGMAWGWKFGGEWGKALLTLFRLAAVIFGSWYLGRIVKQKYSKGFIICAALIYAGALGNLIDSMFYGMIFENSTYSYVAKMFPKEGYAGFLHGHVVDMLYFPIIHSTYPDWIPFIGGKEFEFFSPIFNIADASISIGVIILLLFQKRFFKKEDGAEVHAAKPSKADISSNYELGNIE